MPKHTTQDPAKRAEHIAEHENKVRSLDDLKDWPRPWLKTYDQVVRELAGK